ncbi:hypothetical protein L7F22_009319 [Adiantum nelumboides]|nr:hypothetical protein [Adiantum nelumboides]
MATTTSHNKKSSAVKRILSEARELKEATSEYTAFPLDDNIFEWHFTLRGPSQSEFEEGFYHGRILLPIEYPFRPPDVMILTPNGRWELNKKICLTFTGFHEEMWQPAWGIRTALIGVQAFMSARAEAAVGIGSLDYPIAERERLAKLSGDWKCPVCDRINREMLPNAENSSRIQEDLPEGLTIDPTGGKKKEKEVEAEASSATVNGSVTASSESIVLPSIATDDEQSSFEGNRGPSNDMLEGIIRSRLEAATLQPSISSSQVSTPGLSTPHLEKNEKSYAELPNQDDFSRNDKGKGRERSYEASESNNDHAIQDGQHTTQSTTTPHLSSQRPSLLSIPSMNRQNSQPLPFPTPRTAAVRLAFRAGASSAEASAQRLAALDRAIVTVICLLAALILRRIMNAWS